MNIKIREARPEEAELLTDLTFRSKQSNGYDNAFMEACRERLVVTQERVRRSAYWVAVSDSICGAVCLDIDPDGHSGEIHSFFVEPDMKRKGIGRLLWTNLLDHAKAKGLSTIRLDADPAAVSFYQASGFEIKGDAPSGSIPGRRIPHMVYRL